MKKPHLSVTQLDMFTTCGIRYYFRYIEGLKMPPKSAMKFGKNIHEAELDLNLKQKITTHEDLKLADVTDAFATAWNKDVQEVQWNEEERSQGIEIISGKLKDEGIRVVETLHTEWADRIQPKKVEEKFLIKIPEFDYDFMGIWDLITDDKKIIDLKVSSKSPASGIADKSLQLTVYSLAYRNLNRGGIETGLELNYAVRLKQPKIIIQQTQRDQSHYDRFLKRLGKVAYAIKNEVFVPADSNSWVCSPDACGYWDICTERP